MALSLWLILNPPSGLLRRLMLAEQALSCLNVLEEGFPAQEQEAVRAAKKWVEEEPEALEQYEGGAKRWLEESGLPEALARHRVWMPMTARYMALSMAVAGMETVIQFLDDKSLRNETNHDRGGRSQQQGIRRTLTCLAQDAGMQGKKFPEMDVFPRLWTVRNNIIHCWGRVQDAGNPRKVRKVQDAAKMLGFSTADKMLVNGKQVRLGGEQVWIERGALDAPVGKALAFIEKVCKAHLHRE